MAWGTLPLPVGTSKPEVGYFAMKLTIFRYQILPRVIKNAYLVYNKGFVIKGRGFDPRGAGNEGGYLSQVFKLMRYAVILIGRNGHNELASICKHLLA